MAKSVLELVSLRSEPIPPQTGSWRVNLSDPARTVMTDFNEHNIVAVAPKQQVDEALEAMRHAGVRSAFVLNESRSAVLGLITAYDIMGEKPLRHIQMVGGVREDVMVADIMDRAPEWQVLQIGRAHV